MGVLLEELSLGRAGRPVRHCCSQGGQPVSLRVRGASPREEGVSGYESADEIGPVLGQRLGAERKRRHQASRLFAAHAAVELAHLNVPGEHAQKVQEG